MKAILVIEMPEEYMGSNIDVKLYGKNHTIHERYVNKLKPLPQKKEPKEEWLNEYHRDEFADGWNACLKEIEE